MKKLLVVVDMQNDFIDGALGTPEAQAIIPNVVKKIKSWDGDIICTRDAHSKRFYFETQEGKHLPIQHCIWGTHGYKINSEVEQALKDFDVEFIDKDQFASLRLPLYICSFGCVAYDYVELIGLCTDICVVANAFYLKAVFPELDIAVDASCCAGTTPENHKAALTVMNTCQIRIIGGSENV